MPATVEGTRTDNRPARKPVCRRASYHRVNAVYGTVELTIGEGEKAEVFGYHVEDIRHQFGPTFRAFNLTKYEHQRTEGEPISYDVLIDLQPVDPESPGHSCECLGWLRWHRCKHVSALLSLIRTNKI